MKIGRYQKNLKNILIHLERLVNDYYTDMEEYINFSLEDFFFFLSKYIAYKSDPEGYELLMRPSVLLSRGAGDCDDKTICALSYFKCKNISCGYSIVSQFEFKNYHHIFPFIIINNQVYDFDATYSHNKYLERLQYAKRADKIIYQG